MEVLARIPELESAAAVAPIATAAEAAADASVADERPETRPAERVHRGASPPAGFRSPPLSVITLAVVAVAVWAAAWRNERLRLEAQRARPERLAQELPAVPGPTRTAPR